MDGVAGVIPDLSLAIAIVYRRGRRVNYNSMGYRWHRYCHSYYACICFAVCAVVFHSRLSSILMRHLLLDYLTHNRNWLRYGHTKVHRS
jgi:hypothetical protein